MVGFVQRDKWIWLSPIQMPIIETRGKYFYDSNSLKMMNWIIFALILSLSGGKLDHQVIKAKFADTNIEFKQLATNCKYS